VRKPYYLRKILGLIAGRGLLTVTGDAHRKMRRAMNPAFALQNLMARTWKFSLLVESAQVY
jgi:cytochrome P450